LRQGIFDQKTWDEKEEEKMKPNPTFRIRWGAGDVFIHSPVQKTRALDDGSIVLTKLHFSAVENVPPIKVWVLMAGRGKSPSGKVTRTTTRTHKIHHLSFRNPPRPPHQIPPILLLPRQQLAPNRPNPPPRRIRIPPLAPRLHPLRPHPHHRPK
jgi:hypothetical protein